MRVVIRRRVRRRDADGAVRSRRWAIGAALLVQALALVSFAICVWRWSYDLGWVTSFLVIDGFLARWQVWFGLAAALQILASLIARYGRSLQPSAGNESGRVRAWLKRHAA